MKLKKREIAFWIFFFFFLFLLFIYLVLKFSLWKDDFQLPEFIVLGVFLTLFLIFITFIFINIRNKVITSNFASENDVLNILNKVIDAQKSVLIAFDADLNVIWTNDSKFFIKFCSSKKFYHTPLTQFLPTAVVTKINNQENIKNFSFQIKNKKTGLMEKFYVSLVQDSILFLQNQQLSFELKNWILANKLVFFLLQVDFDDFNFDFDGVLSQKRKQILTTIESEITQNLVDYKIWLTTPKEGFFVLLLKSADLQKLKKNNFNFIKRLSEKVRNQFQVILTFSGGIYEVINEVFANPKDYVFHPYDVANIYQQSLYALQMAVSRFGDQIVLTQSDGAFQVFGKQSQKLQSVVDLEKVYKKFLSKIKKFKTVCLIGHTNADLDVFGSGLATQHLLGHLFPEKKIFFIMQKPESKALTAVKKILGEDQYSQSVETNFATLNKKVTLEGAALCLLDTNQVKNLDLSPLQLKKFSNIFIIDHHIDNFAFKNPIFKFVDNKFSSASEILTHFLTIEEVKGSQIKIPDYIVKLLLMGISIDTNNLQGNLGNQTIKAVNFLTQKKIDLNEIFQLINKMKTQVIPKKLETISVASDKVILRVFDSFIQQDNAASIADQYLIQGKLTVVFVVLFDEKKNVFVSARSEVGSNFNVEPICKHLGGGGDNNRGGAQFLNANPDKIIKKITTLMKKIIVN